jgi:hypothetical protein
VSSPEDFQKPVPPRLMSKKSNGDIPSLKVAWHVPPMPGNPFNGFLSYVLLNLIKKFAIVESPRVARAVTNGTAVPARIQLWENHVRGPFRSPVPLGTHTATERSCRRQV